MVRKLFVVLAILVAASVNASAIAQEKAAPSAPAAAPVAPAAAPAPAAPPAPTKPELIDTSKINSGDTAWMLTSMALVLMMTIPGLGLFYAGMVRKKNVLATVMQSFAITCVVTILWFVIGYSAAFTNNDPAAPGAIIGSFAHFFLAGIGPNDVNPLAPTIPANVFNAFQMTFAIITPALICGAFAERLKFSALLIFMSLW